MGSQWRPLIGTCHSKWLETAGINWHRIELYLCRRGLKFIVPCNQEQRQSLMLIFVKFWWLGAKSKGGGLTPKGIVGNQTHFVFENYWVSPSIWPRFIQIGDVACVAPAWSSHGHSLKCMIEKAALRTMPGHIREFNRLKPHSSHDLVFKIWRNNKTEATLRVFCLWLWVTRNQISMGTTGILI